MKTEIITAPAVRQQLRVFLQRRGIERCVVLCDANVVREARQLVRGMPQVPAVLAFRLSEPRKNFSTLAAVLSSLVTAGAGRDTTVIGVGGGIAADVFGFAASIFMRGVPYVHVATTLVSMVDAAIGGKTGVDLPEGKNLAGTFAEPLGVFAWIDALQTLPYRHLREGLAEVVKHAIIEGADLFEALENLAPHPFTRWPWQSLIEQAQQVKSAIVNDDATERGFRETLNLGHTFAHGIERATAYRVSHGAAVSIGLRAAGLLALRTGRFSRAEHLRVLALLSLLRLPATMRARTADVYAAMQTDKKRRDGRLRFVLPRAIGDVEYGVIVSPARIRTVLDRLRKPPGDDEFR